MTVTAPSDQPCACRAAYRPSGMPTPAAKIIAATVSSIVAGNRMKNSLRTGWLLMTLEPRSPRSRWLR